MIYRLLIGLLLVMSEMCPFQLGIENISPALATWLRSHRVGLITNQTGLDQAGKKTVDILKEQGIFVQALFAPEHGINGLLPAAEHVPDSFDQAQQIPVISLYENETGKKIAESVFKDIDTIVFDIQDSGMRHYTYISTLYEVLKAAGQYNKHLVVFDRPNPLGGVMEGPLVDQELLSFISIAPIPVRHGMTIGELAYYFNKNIVPVPAQLQVVKMKNYLRGNGLTGELQAALSPNIASKASCYGYSFLGLLGEVAPFHVGVGTDKAFQYIMLPKKLAFPVNKWNAFSALLDKINLPHTPHYYFNSVKKEWYEGVQLKIEDINRVQSFTAFLQVLHFFKNAGIEFNFAKFFDKAVGTRSVHDFITGLVSKEQFVSKINSELKTFFKNAKSSFLYQPWPQVKML